MAESLQTVTEFLSSLAPLELAEDWDNVGLLLGDHQGPVRSILACLTLTPDVAEEALAEQASLIVSHHPVLFRPVQHLTTQTTEGRMLLELIRGGVSVYSPHTAFDSARLGINQYLAELLELKNIQPLRPCVNSAAGQGVGRQGCLPRGISFGQALQLVRTRLGVRHLQYVGEVGRCISRIGIACGSAGELLQDAQAAGCDLFLTGETRFHTALEARTLGIGLILAGHYGTERPGVERLADLLQQQFPELKVWASRRECDPVLWSSG